MNMVPLGKLMPSRIPSVNPSKHLDETFELWSIPAFDQGEPERLKGSEIGSSKKCVEPDDVLLSRIVPHIRRSWVVGPLNGARQIASGEWITFRSPKIFPQYLRHFLISDEFHAQFMKTVAGVGGSLLRARPEGVKQIEVPLPPLDEQKRIATILDQADGLRHLRQRAVSTLEKMKTAVFHQMFSQSVDTQSLRNIIKVGSGNGLTAKDMRGGDVPVYGGNGINGWHDEAFVDPQTVIIGRVGVYCGAVHVTEKKAWVTDNALIVKKLIDIETDYLAEALRAANLNQYAGRSAQPLVSGSRIYPVEIPLPPIEDQRQFTERTAAIASQQLALQRSSESIERLFSSLQHRAFRGKL